MNLALPLFRTPLTPGRSPSGRWELKEEVALKGSALYGFDGGIIGDATEDLTFLHLYERETDWMSNRPNEVQEAQKMAARASGSVVVAGLGLGMWLSLVRQRPEVTYLTLIERDQELTDWILPRLGLAVDEVVVGDVMVELPKLTADWAMVDIFQPWGSGARDVESLKVSCPNIKRWWIWGHPQLSNL